MTITNKITAAIAVMIFFLVLQAGVMFYGTANIKKNTRLYNRPTNSR